MQRPAALIRPMLPTTPMATRRRHPGAAPAPWPAGAMYQSPSGTALAARVAGGVGRPRNGVGRQRSVESAARAWAASSSSSIPVVAHARTVSDYSTAILPSRRARGCRALLTYRRAGPSRRAFGSTTTPARPPRRASGRRLGSSSTTQKALTAAAHPDLARLRHVARVGGRAVVELRAAGAGDRRVEVGDLHRVARVADVEHPQARGVPGEEGEAWRCSDRRPTRSATCRAAGSSCRSASSTVAAQPRGSFTPSVILLTCFGRAGSLTSTMRPLPFGAGGLLRADHVGAAADAGERLRVLVGPAEVTEAHDAAARATRLDLARVDHRHAGEHLRGQTQRRERADHRGRVADQRGVGADEGAVAGGVEAEVVAREARRPTA